MERMRLLLLPLDSVWETSGERQEWRSRVQIARAVSHSIEQGGSKFETLNEDVDRAELIA